jgi:hypothetical protein
MPAVKAVANYVSSITRFSPSANRSDAQVWRTAWNPSTLPRAASIHGNGAAAPLSERCRAAVSSPQIALLSSRAKSSHSGGSDVTVEDDAGVDAGGVRSLTLKRIALTAATAFAAVNIWTGCPLLALWVASQTSGEHRITMAALGVFLITVALLEGVMIIALAWLNNVYDEVTGRERVERRSPWLRAMSEEAERHVSQRVGISLPERIVMIIVYFAVIAFAVWYVFFASTSSLHCFGQC